MDPVRRGSLLVLVSFALLGTLFPLRDNQAHAQPHTQDIIQPRSAPVAYLPLLVSEPAIVAPGPQWQSPFGAQPVQLLASGVVLSRTLDLHIGWVRLGSRIYWSALQPTEGGPIRWELLSGFEDELRMLKRAGITPVISILSSPRWATINQPFPTSCGAIRPDKYAAYAQFVGALAARYHTSEFNVHHWELGNEPDVDPSLVPADSVFGCWGNIQDPYYGGRSYGEMLKVVSPAMKAADPGAQIWIGGLLLDRPETTDPTRGKPELFLKGVLEAGAAPYFDVVAYHAYAQYRNEQVDYDTTAAWVWTPWGGRVLGKARFLRQQMSAYGIDKPLFLNEWGLLWCGSRQGCSPPGESFYDMQANFAVRSGVRGVGGGLQGLIWYTLDGPGYRYSGLLDGSGNPKPVYRAYQQLLLQLNTATYIGVVDYGVAVEAYAFRRSGELVQVVWTKDATAVQITLPQSRFRGAFDRDGDPLIPVVIGTNYQLTVGFEPIYLILNP
jgi:hypothetical protein